MYKGGSPRPSIPGRLSAGYLDFMPGHWDPLYLQVKHMEMLDVLDVGHGHPILVGEPERFGPVFFCDTEGSLPHGGDFVLPFS